MTDVIITGATRGIGHALALALLSQPELRLVLVGRAQGRLDELVRAVAGRGGRAVGVRGELGSLRGAQLLGERLSEIVQPGATLVHNAGVWPARRVLTPEGLEEAFVVNHLAPLTLQAPLLARGLVQRVMVVGAGLMIKGRFDAERTPWGRDFSAFRTYCTTKLCFAISMRQLAASHPELDVVVLHPGVVRTELGARSGPVGLLLSLVKRTWEAPEVCAARLARILTRPRWSMDGKAPWLVEEREEPWPAVACDVATQKRLHEVSERLRASLG